MYQLYICRKLSQSNLQRWFLFLDFTYIENLNWLRSWIYKAHHKTYTSVGDFRNLKASQCTNVPIYTLNCTEHTLKYKNAGSRRLVSLNAEHYIRHISCLCSAWSECVQTHYISCYWTRTRLSSTYSFYINILKEHKQRV